MDFLRISNFKNKDDPNYNSAYLMESTRREKDYTEDYILPDYLPDAKKILRFTAKPIIETRFMGNSSLEFSGSIYCKALYLAEDSSVKCAAFSFPFEDRLSGEDLTDECVDLLSPRVFSAVCRLQNPRKMNIRLRAGADIEVYSSRSCMPELYSIPTGQESSLQTNVRSVNSMNVTVIREDDLSASEDINIDKSMPPISEIIYSDAEVIFDECHGGKNEVICRGSIIFECIYLSSNGETHFIRRNIPISETLSAENATSDSFISALCLCKNPDVNAVNDEFGEKRVLELDLSYGTEIFCMNPKKVLYAADCYSTRYNTESNYKSLTFHTPAEKIIAGYSVNESIEGKECSMQKGDVISAFFLEPVMELSKNGGKRGKLSFEGTCAVSLILKNSENPPREVNFSIPLRYESDRPFDAEGVYSHKTICKVSNPRIRFDGERVYTDLEISLSSDVILEKTLSAISNIRVLPSSAPAKKASEILVYYPSPDEDIWEVSKKYSVTREALSETNSISSGELPCVLKIPSKR